MSDSNWISQLKAGDQVIVSGRWGSRIALIDKVTKTGLVKVNGTVYNTSGNERGGGVWDRTYIEEATPEVVQTFNRRSVIHNAYSKMNTATNITYDQAVKILEILNNKE